MGERTKILIMIVLPAFAILIASVIWITFCVLFGMYDAYLYFLILPEKIEKRTFTLGSRSFRVDVPHLIAYAMRALAALVIAWLFLEMLDIIALGLMLPLIHTGSYLQFRATLSRWTDSPIPKDANGKPYYFFSKLHKHSGWFPDHTPVARVAMFVIGICLMLFV
jgi:hypothetical protein